MWAIAIPMNATPWKTWTRRYWLRGSPRSPTRPHAGLVSTVTSDEIAEDPAGPAERRRGVVRADRLDVERQADEGERPGEAPEEHRDREGTRDPRHPVLRLLPRVGVAARLPAAGPSVRGGAGHCQGPRGSRQVTPGHDGPPVAPWNAPGGQCRAGPGRPSTRKEPSDESDPVQEREAPRSDEGRSPGRRRRPRRGLADPGGLAPADPHVRRDRRRRGRPDAHARADRLPRPRLPPGGQHPGARGRAAHPSDGAGGPPHARHAGPRLHDGARHGRRGLGHPGGGRARLSPRAPALHRGARDRPDERSQRPAPADRPRRRLSRRRTRWRSPWRSPTA